MFNFSFQDGTHQYSKFSLLTDCCCHLQGECVVACFRKCYIEQAVGGKWVAIDLTGRREE
jgi:hypothetical protein